MKPSFPKPPVEVEDLIIAASLVVAFAALVGGVMSVVVVLALWSQP